MPPWTRPGYGQVGKWPRPMRLALMARLDRRLAPLNDADGRGRVWRRVLDWNEAPKEGFGMAGAVSAGRCGRRGGALREPYMQLVDGEDVPFRWAWRSFLRMLVARSRHRSQCAGNPYLVGERRPGVIPDRNGPSPPDIPGGQVHVAVRRTGACRANPYLVGRAGPRDVHPVAVPGRIVDERRRSW